VEDFNMKLDGKQLLIIGGSSGIGLETARLALAEGALVTIAGRSEERLRNAAQNLGSDRVRSVVVDLSDESSIRSLFAEEARIDHIFVPAGELRPADGDAFEVRHGRFCGRFSKSAFWAWSMSCGRRSPEWIEARSR